MVCATKDNWRLLMKKMVVIGLMCMIGLSTMACKSNQKEPFVPKVVENPETVSFASQDGISVFADVYMPYDEKAPFILLCHRAGWSRGEYREIAPKLNELGFNCMAIDQRSGKAKNDVTNETALIATNQGKKTQFVDAEQDIHSAITYAKNTYAKGTFLLWGSSYSSSLSIVIASQRENELDGLLCFSPGEYFTDQGKDGNWIKKSANEIKKIPVFFTSKNSEQGEVRSIFDYLKTENKTYYCPSFDSKHGSQALYADTPNNEWTWIALKQFLAQFR